MPDLPTTPLARPQLPAAAAERSERLALDPDDPSAPAIGTAADPLPGAWAVGLPPFFIDTFPIPPFLLPIYQAAENEYGVRWEVLAAINEIETNFGRTMGVSSAGAIGWMQFLPSTFARYGVDGNGDGRKDPYNPVDAIFSAARYLRAAGAATDLSSAIYAYNHAQWYVDAVLERARLIAGVPLDLVTALSGIAQARPPVLGPAQPAADVAPGRTERTLILRTRPRSPVVAVADGVVTRTGSDPRLGRIVQLRDVFGNTYTYGHLGSIATRYPVLADPGLQASAAAPPQAPTDAPPTVPASAGLPPAAGELGLRVGAPATAQPATSPGPTPPALAPVPGAAVAGEAPDDVTSLLTPLARTDWAAQAQRIEALRASAVSGRRALSTYDRRLLGDPPASAGRYRALHVGARVIAGTILGHAENATPSQGQIAFEIRPAGSHADTIAPRPIVAGWRLLQRATGSVSLGAGSDPAIGQLLLLAKPALQRRVAGDARIQLTSCDRDRVRAGAIDRRVLAALELLAASGLHPTVGVLQCGAPGAAAAGPASNYATGDAVDISALNGATVAGDGGARSDTATAVRVLLSLKGTMKPRAIVSPLSSDGSDDGGLATGPPGALRISFTQTAGSASIGTRISNGILEASAWRRLGSRLGTLRNPVVATTPSRFALPAPGSAVPRP